LTMTHPCGLRSDSLRTFYAAHSDVNANIRSAPARRAVGMLGGARASERISKSGIRNERRLKENPMRGAALIALAIAASAPSASAQSIDWKQIDGIFNRTAAVTGDVHRYGFPRGDLSVTLDEVQIKPALALGGWIAFKPAHDGAMAMADLVLLDAEVSPVM